MGKIVTLGEVVADVYRERSPSEVEQPFTARPGGAPANVAVAAARLGVESGFIGRLGDDLFGDFILHALAASGVDAGLSLLAVVSYQLISTYLPALPGIASYVSLRRRMKGWPPVGPDQGRLARTAVATPVTLSGTPSSNAFAASAKLMSIASTFFDASDLSRAES